MKIIVDAMGGDYAPKEFVLGTFAAAKEYQTEILLVGQGELLLKTMKQLGYDTLPTGVEIANADEVVSMEDDPSRVVRCKKNSSLVLGMKLLADGMGDAFISGGNTGAILSAATLLVKRIRGVRRAAFCPLVPVQGGRCIIIDAGANIECSPEFLLQFGYIGYFYAKCALGLENPRVGLLNNGTETQKGDELHRQAFDLLYAAGERGDLNFVGNVEGRDVPLGVVDIVVCDGFSGNVLLKSIEGTAMFMAKLLRDAMETNRRTRLAALLCQKELQPIRRIMDYREVGGTVLLGIAKPVIKAHGSSDARAVKNAVRQALDAVNMGVCDTIRQNATRWAVPKER